MAEWRETVAILAANRTKGDEVRLLKPLLHFKDPIARLLKSPCTC